MKSKFIFEVKVLAVVLIGVMLSSCSYLKSITGKNNGEEQVVKSERVKKSYYQMSYSRIYRSGTPEMKFNYAMRLFNEGKFDKAIALYDIAYPHLLNKPQADSLAFYRALSYFRRGAFRISSEEFDRFRKRFTNSVFTEESEFLYAKSFYYMSPRPERDQTTTLMAMNSLSDYLDRYPQTTHREEINGYIVELRQKLYDKELLNAKVYYNVGHYKSATYALKNILATQPETTHREEVMYLIVKSSYNLAENSIEELQHGRYLDVVDNYYNFISEYPETKYRKELDKLYEKVQKFVNQKKDNKESEDGNQEERSE